MLRFYTGFSESFMSSGSYSKQELYAAHFFCVQKNNGGSTVLEEFNL